jgi:peroxiredoxin (alkyl hydroperoxide reductase subunit C)
MLTVGDKFPQYKLNANMSVEPGKEFGTVSTQDNEGKWTVFYAYPKDFTFVCPTEIVEFDRLAPEFQKRNAVVVGGSTDNEYSHLAWRQQHPDLNKMSTPLVFITPQLASDLGILHKAAGAALRVTFIVDPQATIRAVTATDLSVGRNVEEVLRQLDALQTEKLTPCGWKPGQKTLN